MNTPPTPKRFNPKRTEKPPAHPGGQYSGAITNPNFAVRFAQLVTSFVHLEEQMSTVLAALLGAVDQNPARYVLRTIRSPTGRIDVLKALLEECQINAHRDQFYDEVISEFASINRKRNDYVHGQWWTHESGRTFLVEFMDDLHLMNAREVATDELDALCSRIGALALKTATVPRQHIHEHLVQLQELFAREGEPKGG